MRQSFKGSFSIILAAVFFIGALFIYADFIKPTYSDIKNKQGEKSQKEAEYNKFKTLFEQNQQILSSFENYQNLYNSILIMLPTNPNISQAIYQINGIASASGMSIKSISTSEAAITPSSSTLIGGRGTTKINLKLNGTYESFKAFLERVETNIRIFRVSSIRVEKFGASNFLDFNMELDAFYQTADTSNSRK